MDSARHVNQDELNKHLQTPPGQFVSLDLQCRHMFGSGSYYCGVSEICHM